MNLELSWYFRMVNKQIVPSGKRTVRYWTWPFIVDLPIKNGGSFHINHHFPMVFPSFSHKKWWIFPSCFLCLPGRVPWPEWTSATRWRLHQGAAVVRQGCDISMLNRYHLVMTNIANWKDPPFLSSVNHRFLCAIYTMAILNNQRVTIHLFIVSIYVKTSNANLPLLLQIFSISFTMMTHCSTG